MSSFLFLFPTLFFFRPNTLFSLLGLENLFFDDAEKKRLKSFSSNLRSTARVSEINCYSLCPTSSILRENFTLPILVRHCFMHIS
jgi:hypothetical protein